MFMGHSRAMLSVILRLFTVAIVMMHLNACNLSKSKITFSENDVPVMWADMTLYITKNTPANSPTFASRAFGYTGVTMYECVVNSSPVHQSLGRQLNNLPRLPVPENNKPYNRALSLNAGQAAILRSLYIQTSKTNKIKIDSLENLIYHAIAGKLADTAVAKRSVAYGKAVASVIFEWSKTDGGHRGYLANFDSRMAYPSHSGTWKPPFFAQQISRWPLHPHWGDNRTFLHADTNWKMPAFVPYDTTALSQCYKQFMLVYQANKNITAQQKEIALWWNDDPSETYTPPGHSYNLASTVIRTKNPGIVQAAETYARVGLAVADAFIVCWKIKYNFFSERPSTYVNEHIDSEWDPFWPDPPFPAFPSGHATQASAVAIALAGLYGNAVTLTDSSHVGRPRDKVKDVDYKPRQFTSFWQIAEETASSRFFGGIHTMEDNNTGLAEGRKIGQHVNELKWRK